MAKQTIGIGTVANDGTGDDLRTGGDKINDNFNELYTALGDGSTLGLASAITAAGALMDSEVTNLADVKAFDPTDYATAAQGSTADSAVQPGDAWTGLNGTAWRVAYTNGTGDVTELALGDDGTFLKSNGAAAAPTFATPAGSGDVSKVGTPANNQLGVWTGDGTIEGVAALTYDGTDFMVASDILFDADGTRDIGDATNRVGTLHVDSIDLNGSTFTGTTLADPGADAIMGWDDSASEAIFFTIGTGLTAAGTTISATGLQAVSGDADPVLGGELDGAGNEIANYVNAVISATGTLTVLAHSGNVVVTSGNVTVPTTPGFTCTIIAGGAHTVSFNSTTSAAMATGDVMTVVVQSSTVIHAVLTAAADKVSFT